jgi:membrane protein implicated in regulation of membrane protease activity
MDLPTLFLICLGVGLVFTVVSAFAGHLTGAHLLHGDIHGHVDAGGGSHQMPGFPALSPTTIALFLTAFGGLGLIFVHLEWTRGWLICIPLSVMGAFVVAAAAVQFFRSIFKVTQSSSEARVGRLVGNSATIITPIPANGVGEIAYVQGGSRYSAPAREEDGIPVSGGSTVRITRIVGTQFYVRVS